jgi:hypothetical protein
MSFTTAQNTTTINLSAEDLLYIHRVDDIQCDEDKALRDQIAEGNVDLDTLNSFTQRLDHAEVPLEHPDDARFVYAIRVRGTNRVKIGFSKDPMQLLATLQAAHAGLLDLELIMRTHEYRALESALHHKHRGRRIGRSWFCFEENINFLTFFAL